MILSVSLFFIKVLSESVILLALTIVEIIKMKMSVTNFFMTLNFCTKILLQKLIAQVK
jgi:hypothetical protein